MSPPFKQLPGTFCTSSSCHWARKSHASADGEVLGSLRRAPEARQEEEVTGRTTCSIKSHDRMRGLEFAHGRPDRFVELRCELVSMHRRIQNTSTAGGGARPGPSPSGRRTCPSASVLTPWVPLGAWPSHWPWCQEGLGRTKPSRSEGMCPRHAVERWGTRRPWGAPRL